MRSLVVAFVTALLGCVLGCSSTDQTDTTQQQPDVGCQRANEYGAICYAQNDGGFPFGWRCTPDAGPQPLFDSGFEEDAAAPGAGVPVSGIGGSLFCFEKATSLGELFYCCPEPLNIDVGVPESSK